MVKQKDGGGMDGWSDGLMLWVPAKNATLVKNKWFKMIEGWMDGVMDG